ncbi:MAG: hypothetical protein GX185_00265 [Tissierellia bacterium]|nr:hypothetical protein [Tissierellia bacterium]
MKINFTKKQFRKLLDLVFLGELVINGHRPPDEAIGEYEDLLQYIYSFAKEMGYEDLIEYSSEYDKFFETRKFDESGIQDYVDEYDENVFWFELALRLAKRDVIREVEADEIGGDDYLLRVLHKEELYQDEFYENGLQNVIVDSDKINE